MKFLYILRTYTLNNGIIRRFAHKKDVFIKPKRGSKGEKDSNIKKSIQYKIRDNLEKAKNNVERNTPKVIGVIMIGLSLPQFKLLYELLQTEYENLRFFQLIRASVDWCNMKSAFLLGTFFGLEAIKFIDNKAKYRMSSSKLKFILPLIPFALNLLTLSYWNYLDKKIILGNCIGGLGAFVLEARMTTEGRIPYWFYNIKYNIFLFDLIFLIALYWSLKNLRKQLEEKPFDFVEIERISEKEPLKK